VEQLETRTVPSTLAGAHHLFVLGAPPAALEQHVHEHVIDLHGHFESWPAGPPTVLDPSMPNVMTQSRSFTGTFSGLGAVTGTVEVTTTFGADGTMTFSDTFTVTTATGDKVTGTGAGTLTPMPSKPGMLELKETWTFTGGEGKYAGASGQAAVRSEVNAATGVETAGSAHGMLMVPRA
jgi:hypothetical protein